MLPIRSRKPGLSPTVASNRVWLEPSGVYHKSRPLLTIFGSAGFDEAVRAAGRKAFVEALASGVPVFYVDADGLNVMERAESRKFEIRWLPGAPSGENFEIICELTANAA